MSLPEGTILKLAQNILLPDDQVAVNVFWAVLEDSVGSGPLAVIDVLAAASNYMDEVYENLLALIADTVVSTVVEVWEVDGPTGDLTPIGDELTTWTPTGGTDILPNGVAGIISAKTTNTDVTARKFFPGFLENNCDENNWISGALTSMISAGADWVDGWVDPNEVEFIGGVYSMTKHNFFMFTDVVLANAIAGYQRRRKPGVGS